MRLSICFCLLALSCLAAGPRNPSGQPQQFVIGISPFLDKPVKDDVYRGIVRLLVEDLPLNSSVAIYDAFHLKSIARVSLPEMNAFHSAKTRANQFSPAIRELKSFLASDSPRPATNRLDFDSSIRLPQFCDFLAESLAPANSPVVVLLFGSPFYEDAKEPRFSMVDGFFPSDGHLQAPRERTLFGLEAGAQPQCPMLVHWVYFGEPWLNELHKEKVTRFWTFYLQKRAGRLATFSSDLPTALEAFRQGTAMQAEPVNRWSLDASQTNVEMLRVSREIRQTDWLLGGTSADTAQGPPDTLLGPMKIGIRWKENIDLDLYATPRPGAETLFFQHTCSPEGYYYKDHRSSPGREYEFIEFESAVDVRQVEAFVNFYKGSCPGGPHGDVRIEFAGRIYGAPFRVESAEGNRGRTGPGQEECWTRIPIEEILKLPPGQSRGG